MPFTHWSQLWYASLSHWSHIPMTGKTDYLSHLMLYFACLPTIRNHMNCDIMRIKTSLLRFLSTKQNQQKEGHVFLTVIEIDNVFIFCDQLNIQNYSQYQGVEKPKMKNKGTLTILNDIWLIKKHIHAYAGHMCLSSSRLIFVGESPVDASVTMLWIFRHATHKLDRTENILLSLSGLKVFSKR